MTIPDLHDRVRGCLLGGAVGDALGLPVEFMGRAAIDREHPHLGGDVFGSGGSGPAPFSDDTQMTLFTAEGLIRAIARHEDRGICDPVSVVHHAYMRWLATQGMSSRHESFEFAQTGWLLTEGGLHEQRAPGNTCLSALVGDTSGTMDAPLNDSKGCGGVMRAAPAGMLGDGGPDPFVLGCEIAAITHGHPSGYLSAGFLAQLIRAILDGAGLDDAIESAAVRLRAFPEHAECLDAVGAAVDAARTRPRTPETVESLGAGWVGEEALAIALFCALAAEEGDLASALHLAVIHGGDSDSTGAITGNILGAMWGASCVPPAWRERLHLASIVERVAADLVTAAVDRRVDLDRYPPN